MTPTKATGTWILGKRSTGKRLSDVVPSTTMASDNIRMPIRFRNARRVNHIRQQLMTTSSLSLHWIEGLGLHRRSVVNEVLPGHDNLFGADESFCNLDAVLVTPPDFHRDAFGLSIADDVHVLRVLQPADGINRNLQRVVVFPHKDFDTGE